MDLYSGFKRYLGLGMMGAAICAITSNVAYSKPVELKWSQVKGAQKYEVEITKNGKSVVQEKLVETHFKADLDPGSYTYKFRAVDSFGRGGRWSSTKDLIVTAPAPVVDASEIPEKIQYTGSFPGLPLKWKKVEGAQSYEVSFKNKSTGETVYKKEVSSNKLKVDALKSGDYEIVISSVIEANGRKFTSKVPVAKTVTVTEKKMESPEDLLPNGNVMISEDPRVRLEWKEVKGAEKYEVTLEPIDGRSVAGEKRVRSWIVSKNEVEVPVTLGTKKYKWKVRAIARAGESSDQSVSEFSTVKDIDFGGREGSIQVGGNNMQFTGRLESGNGGGGSAAGMGWGYSVKADYWFGRKLGVEALYESLSFNMETGSFSLRFMGAMAKARWRLRDSPDAWKVYFKLGYGAADFFKHSVNQNGGSMPSLFTGMIANISAVKALSDEFELDFGVYYFLPTSISDGTPIVRMLENGLVRPQVQISHLLSKSLSVAIGARYDLRQSFSGPSNTPTRFVGSSASVDLSIKYRFGDISDFKVSDVLSEGTRKIASINEIEAQSKDPLKANHGVLEIAGGIMPFDTNTSIQTGTLTNNRVASGVSYRNAVRVEYWPWRYSGLFVDFESSYYLLTQADRTVPEISLGYSRRFYLENVLGGSIVIAKLGAAMRGWLLLGSNSVDVQNRIGPLAEIEFRKLWNKTMFSVMGQYQYPSVGVVRGKVFHPIYKGLEFGLEGFWETQFVQVDTQSSVSRTNMGLLGLLRYRFGVAY